jgi:hypothetical protein
MTALAMVIPTRTARIQTSLRWRYDSRLEDECASPADASAPAARVTAVGDAREHHDSHDVREDSLHRVAAPSFTPDASDFTAPGENPLPEVPWHSSRVLPVRHCLRAHSRDVSRFAPSGFHGIWTGKRPTRPPPATTAA